MPVLYPCRPLKIERLRCGVTLVDLAAAVGVSVSMLSLIEREKISKPDIVAAVRRYLAAVRQAS